MRLYYINLDRRPDRRAEIEQKLSALGLSAERVAAVTPAELTDAQRRDHCDPTRRHWMTDVELCCSLSHVKVLELFLADGGSHAIVLEDDIVLSSALPSFLKEFEASSAEVELLRLETDLNGQRLMPHPDAVIAGIEIRQSWSWAAGTAAYIVSRAAAQKILGSRDLLRFAADEAVFNPYKAQGRGLKMRHCLPALAVQADRLDPNRRDSDIAAARAQHSAPGTLSWTTQVIRRMVGILETEILQGTQRQFHTVFGGARKMPVPFMAD